MRGPGIASLVEGLEQIQSFGNEINVALRDYATCRMVTSQMLGIVIPKYGDPPDDLDVSGTLRWILSCLEKDRQSE